MSFWSEWSDGKKWFMGIASALIIAALIGLAKFLLTGETGLPEQRVPFSASSEPVPFAIKSSFGGKALVAGNKVVVEVVNASLSYANTGGYAGPRRIEDVRVSLAEAAEGSWRSIRRSGRHEIGRMIAVGEMMELKPFTVTIDVDGLESLSGHWLVFDIADQIPSGPTTAGLSHAHTRRDLF